MFEVDCGHYTKAEMLEANADDSDLCEWLRTANVGDHFSAFVSCSRIA